MIGRAAITFSVSGASAMRWTRSATSITTSGSSSGGSPMHQLRYEVWLQVGQSTETSARTRGGCSSPGQAVGGLPRHVAQEDVHLEALLHGLALEQRPVERGTHGVDDVNEEVVQHAARG